MSYLFFGIPYYLWPLSMQSWECWIVLSPISAICDQPVVLTRPPNPPIPMGMRGLKVIWVLPNKLSKKKKKMRCRPSATQSTEMFEEWRKAKDKALGYILNIIDFLCAPKRYPFSNILWCFDGFWFLKVRPVFRRHHQQQQPAAPR